MAVKRAAALAYNVGDPAPRVIAAGRGAAAERVVELARAAGVKIVEDAALAALIDASTEVGDYIPSWCWGAVAEILAFVLAEEHT